MVETRAMAAKGDKNTQMERHVVPENVPIDVWAPHSPEVGGPGPASSRQESLAASEHPTTSTVLEARKLATEAEHRRRQLEREIFLEMKRREAEEELERKRKEVEALELQAELARLEGMSSRSRGSSRACARTRSWVKGVRERHANTAATQSAIVGEVGEQPRPVVSQPGLPVTNPALHSHPVPSLTRPEPHATSSNDAIGQLAAAIAALADGKKNTLPSFSGSYKEWLAFKSCYERTKHSFSAASNLSRLGEALRGSARDTVESLLHTCGDPDVIISALEQNYARPELMVAREVSALRSFPKVTNAEQLNSFANKVRNCVINIKSLHQEQFLFSPEIFRNALLKLNELTRARFSDYAAEQQHEGGSKLEMLSLFLLREADKQLKYSYVLDFTTGPSPQVGTKPFSNPKRECIHVADTDGTPECTFCKGKHMIINCKDFKLLSSDDRWRAVKEARLCFLCLRRHRWVSCKAKRCATCSKRHHTLLHVPGAPTNEATTNLLHATSVGEETNTSSDTTEEKASTSQDNAIVTNVADTPEVPSSTFRRLALLMILPVVVRGELGEFQTYALLDNGSTATLIDADVASKIGAEEIHREPIRIDGVGGMCRITSVGYTKFFIRGRGMEEEYLVENARAIHNLFLRAQTIGADDLRGYGHLLSLADTLSMEKAVPTILIGAGDWYLSIAKEVRSGKPSQPVATRTLLGWTLHGLFSSSSKPVEYVNNAELGEIEPDSIEALLKEQYKLDCIGISDFPPKNSAEDQRAIDIIEATAHRLPTGRFEVGLPWRHSQPIVIPESYSQALSRFKSLERQMGKNKDFANAYHVFVEGIVAKGYAEECHPSSYHSQVSRCENGLDVRWYLPHFGVYHPRKGKIRVVHDAAAVNGGVSLNSLLLVGPDLLQPLLGILFRFREGKIAVTGDIREMFPQIKIRKADRDAQRFLWRGRNSSDDPVSTPPPIKEFRMSSMIFGAVSSPFMAQYIKNKNALEFQSRYPEATQEIVFNHYMDDYISSFDSLEAASTVASEVFTVHKGCCFEMRSWMSNDARALGSIPKDLWAVPDTEATLPTDASALGIKWDPNSDTLGFRTGNINEPKPKLTKRVILSAVMRVYDPLGLITPIVIRGRILIQDLWREGLGWDSEVPSRYAEVWAEWVKDVARVDKLRISRWYVSSDLSPVDLQLHLFCDSSELAYACVSYWRFVLTNGSVKVVLIGGKARVTPLKPCSIPRLELQAALIAVRFAKTIKSHHRLKPSSTVFWTDSMTVLRWLRGDARRYKSFVAHRVGEILEYTSVRDWRWVPSDLNVADDATRHNDKQTDRWFAGPSFLLVAPKQWPVESSVVNDDHGSPLPEVKETVNFIIDDPAGDPPVPNPLRFSVWLRLLRATARMILAARKFRSVLNKPVCPNSKFFFSMDLSVTAVDIIQAESLLLIKSQLDCFSQEINVLRKSRPLAKTNRLFSLSPRFEDGLLVIDSRIKSLPTSEEETTTRILLDPAHQVVRLLIEETHAKAGHGFNEIVYNELRRRFWILGGRRAIKSVASKCWECKRRKKKPLIPPTGELPIERLEHHVRPFTNVGLDYFGPVEVTVGRRHEKRWVALFSCLVTRALHLEVVSSLSSDAAIMSLRRFIARRGCPAKIISDNGTNFVGASRELSPLFEHPIQKFAVNARIEWLFVPPASPFMAGATERMVRSVKNALRATLKERYPKEDTFHTFLLEAEALCNARPLAYVTTEQDTPQAITPNHFIMGTSSNAQWLAGRLDERDLVRPIQWKQVLRLADHYWARWMREYLPTLLKRPSSSSDREPVSLGDVVVVADPTLPRGVWPLGKVIKVYPGPDQVVRVVDVRTRGGVFKRPVRKLVPLVSAEQAVAIP